VHTAVVPPAPVKPPVPPWTDSARIALVREIDEAGGNEVYFLARFDLDGRIDWVEPLARGGPDSVPAPQIRPQPGEAVIHNHPDGNIQPSEPDLEIASQLGSRGVGFFIIDNEVTKIYRVVEPFREADAEPLELEKIREFFGESGGLARAFESFEPRPEQSEMALAIAGSLEAKGVVIVEAGTGVGKSLGYLMPALDWARRHGKRVVVSTATHTLQRQLMEKDIPLLEKATGGTVKVATLMGRSNYVCKRKAAELTKQETLELDDDSSEALNELARWAASTPTGERSDFGGAVTESQWEKVASQTDQTLRTRCPYYNECFYYQARRKAAAAEILVVNHHLLLMDLSVKSELEQFSDAAVLPPFQAVVVDEAHHLPDTATSASTSSVSASRIAKICQRLISGRDIRKGLLGQFETRVNRTGGKNEGTTATLQIAGGVRAAVQDLRDTGRRIFDGWYDVFFEMAPPEERRNRFIKLRLTRRERSLKDFPATVETPVKELTSQLVRLAGLLETLVKSVRAKSPLAQDAQANLIEFKSLQGRLETGAEDLSLLLNDSAEHCIWVELDSDHRRVTLYRAEVEPGPFLEKALFSQPSIEAVALTSATLAVGRRFDVYERQAGLASAREERRSELLLTSPFDFEHQAMLAAPADIPDPKSDLFRKRLPSLVKDLVLASGGHAFVLFTSYALLNGVWDELDPLLSAAGFSMMRQEAGRKARLIDRFRTADRPVLFATSSFWEGVDVPGDQLRHVIITRLPFTVPSEPIQKARAERVKAQGRSDFDDLSVPQAVIRFRQGFGRLIRTKEDRGVVTVLDSRIMTKGFGRTFLESLPPVRRATGKWENVISDVRQFFRDGWG